MSSQLRNSVILKKKCKYIFKEVLFNSSDHIITHVVLVCLGRRKGKKDVHAKQLTYLKKGRGGALIQSRPALNKNNSLFCKISRHWCKTNNHRCKTNRLALNKRYRIPILVWFEEGKCTLSASGPKNCWQDPAHSSTNFWYHLSGGSSINQNHSKNS